MDAYVEDAYLEQIAKIMLEFNLSFGDAANVWYLRTRSRHTPELESRLIAAAKAGHTINMMEDNGSQLRALGF